MQKPTSPIVKDLVLIGGGHAHAIVLKKLAMQPLAGLRLTLITRDIHTPYSGMLPGFIAGHYDYDECHIDLGILSRFAQARLYHAQVEGLDLANNRVLLPNRPAVHFDCLSINIGSKPSSINVEGVDEFAIAAKPIDVFLQKWAALQAKLLASKGDFKLVIVGGGAGGVELALATQFKLKKQLAEAGDEPNRLSVTLLTESDGIMFSHNKGVRKRFEAVFKQRGIKMKTRCRVNRVHAHSVTTGQGDIAADGVIWVTTASSADWPSESGLAVDEQGFIRVNQYLQSESHANVFAAGDIAHLIDPRPKSGVFAVRQGPVLAHNLKALLTQQAFKVYKPQKNFLGLVSTGDQYAVASRGGWSMGAGWLWQMKNAIDQKFMQQFNQLPEVQAEPAPYLQNAVVDEKTAKALSNHAMRCGGCGAKVGATILSRVLQRLPKVMRDDVLIGRDDADDGALLSVPAEHMMVQSVDYFRAFIDDPYTFGAIAANHALNDLFAMGAQAQSVLAIASVPFATESVVEDTLYDLLSGALSVIEPTGAVLAGGHSSESSELAFGLTVNGLVKPAKVLRKSGLQIGDCLILTKALGTGTLFAADMRLKAKGRWIDAALQSMLFSNQSAAECLQQFNVSACTDVSGFGLLGHLAEMTKASQVDASVHLEALPVLNGALSSISAGIVSTLQTQNLQLKTALINSEFDASNPRYSLLFDPQTAGGLLASVPKQQAEACVQQLLAQGYADARIIGEVTPASKHVGSIRLM